MLFKDKILQEELERNGYVIIPFLKEDEVDDLNNFYDTTHNGKEPPNFIENIHMTSWCLNVDYKLSVTNGLKEILNKSADNHFDDVRTLNHVFIIKRKGNDTTFKVHQDWSVIDETKYQSVNVWIPMHDVNEDSGALWLVKGSHKINRKIRGAGYLFPDYSSFTEELQKQAISVKLKRGEAVVFYHSVIHGSPPNKTEPLRKAACFTVIPKQAPLAIYFQKKEGDTLELHEPGDDFMFRYNELRKEAHIIPPTNYPHLLSAFSNSKVEATELQF